MSMFDAIGRALNLSGGSGTNSLSDPGVHSVDMLRFGAGMPVSQMAPVGTPWGTAPAATGAGAAGLGAGLGWNVGTGHLALGGLGAIGNMWNAFQANGLAKKQFEFQRNTTNTNLANQIKSYNTALSDRARSRAVTEGQSDEQRDRYIADNRMSR